VARRLPTLLLVSVCVVSVSHAQTTPRDTSAVHDSLATQGSIITTDTLQSAAAPHKSTWMAMGLSAVVPGAGQVYNESYWKAPLVFGLGVYFIAEVFRYNRYADDYRQLYLASLSTTPVTQYQTKRDQYKDLRDANIWYFVIVYVLNIVDAYVDASLYGFDVSPTLALRNHPGNIGFSLRVFW
jgi:hypothetical protein